MARPTEEGIILAVVGVGLSVWVTIHAVLHKRDSRAVIGWVGLAWLAPSILDNRPLFLPSLK